MRKYYFLLITLFVGSFCFSQTNSTNKKLLPVSIYTSSLNATNSYNSNSFTSIAKRLNFNKYYKFITVSFDDIDNGRFLISDDNLTTKPTIFIYDDYKKYRDENLLKGFLKKHDLTRWEPCNFRQSNVN